MNSNLERIGAELKQGFLLRKCLGLALVLIGVIGACVGGVFLAMFFKGDATGTGAGIWIGVGLAVSVAGNLIWQRGRVLARRSVRQDLREPD